MCCTKCLDDCVCGMKIRAEHNSVLGNMNFFFFSSFVASIESSYTDSIHLDI